VAYNKQVLVTSALKEKLLEVAEGGLGGEGIREQNLRFIAGFGADQGSSLKATFERARDDEVELNLQTIQNVGEMHALAFAVLVERAFQVQYRIGASHAG
jgi:hypothetical protein